MLTNINFLAVVVASISYYVLGGVWFSPKFFQKKYDEALGFERKNWKPDLKFFLGPLIGCFVISFTTAIVVTSLSLDNLSEFVFYGLVLGIGFTLSTSLINAITPKVHKPLGLGLITGIYHTLGIVLSAVIIYLLG